MNYDAQPTDKIEAFWFSMDKDDLYRRGFMRCNRGEYWARYNERSFKLLGKRMQLASVTVAKWNGFKFVEATALCSVTDSLANAFTCARERAITEVDSMLSEELMQIALVS